MGSYCIGIDAGGTKVAYGLFDESDNLVARCQHPTPIYADGPEFTDIVINTINKIIQDNELTEDDISGIGMGMPSYLLYDKGYVYVTSAMVNIRDFAMRDYFKERISIPVFIDNDANLAALAESVHGAGKGYRDMVYIAIGTGLGSGLILNNALYRGSYGWAGECGHMLITPDSGVECGCRNKGCFMSWTSGRYIPHQVKLKAESADTIIDINGQINGEVLISAYNSGDRLAEDILNQMAKYLGICVYNIYQLLNVNLYVFGGGLTAFGDILFDRVKSEFDRYNHVPLPVEFKYAEMKKDFGIVGAKELAKISVLPQVR